MKNLGELPPVSYLPVWLVDFASIASVVGLALTLYVTYSIWGIRRRYARKGRIPQIVDELRRASSELLAFLNEVAIDQPVDRNAAYTVMQALKPHIHDAREHSTGETKNCARLLYRRLGKLSRKQWSDRELDVHELWYCYRSSIEVATMLESTLLNDAWSA